MFRQWHALKQDSYSDLAGGDADCLGLLNLTLHLANQFLRIHQLFVDLPKKQTILCGLEQCPLKAELPVGPLH